MADLYHPYITFLQYIAYGKVLSPSQYFSGRHYILFLIPTYITGMQLSYSRFMSEPYILMFLKLLALLLHWPFNFLTANLSLYTYVRMHM